MTGPNQARQVALPPKQLASVDTKKKRSVLAYGKKLIQLGYNRHRTTSLVQTPHNSTNPDITLLVQTPLNLSCPDITDTSVLSLQKVFFEFTKPFKHLLKGGISF